jgi:hypothetical protein
VVVAATLAPIGAWEFRTDLRAASSEANRCRPWRVGVVVFELGRLLLIAGNTRGTAPTLAGPKRNLERVRAGWAPTWPRPRGLRRTRTRGCATAGLGPLARGTADHRRGNCLQAQHSTRPALEAPPVEATSLGTQPARSAALAFCVSITRTPHVAVRGLCPTGAYASGPQGGKRGCSTGWAPTWNVCKTVTRRRARFQKPYELDPSAKTLFNLGFAEAQLGRCGDARRTLLRDVASRSGRGQAQKILDHLGTCK